MRRVFIVTSQLKLDRDVRTGWEGVCVWTISWGGMDGKRSRRIGWGLMLGNLIVGVASVTFLAVNTASTTLELFVSENSDEARV